MYRRIGIDVSADIDLLFDSIHKDLKKINWNDDNIFADVLKIKAE